ncbi:MAG: class II fructose-1,6-bisphosphate aldolase [Candidatus Cloacimonadota bacterium]|nr:MAG: class II fructose-1,6-bisphosphate aldolase [Candidatus Cloacimonadota bacterium]
MALESTKAILEKAKREGYAVGAFNINNMETVIAVMDAATELNSPVIIEVTEGAIRYMGIKMASNMVKILSEDVTIPVALHLDHGKKWETILKAIESGFTSVMIDASDRPFEENVEMTQRVVEVAHNAGVSVEAELGRLTGLEDDISVADREAFLVDPEEAENFVTLTGIDFLAPAIGTSHGAFKFKGEPKLDFERLKQVKAKTHIPLVLHGASSVNDRLLGEAKRYGLELQGARGLSDDILKKAVDEGINKVNTDTDIRIAFTTGIRKVLLQKPSVFDPRKILGQARDFMKETVKERIKVLGSRDKG